MTFSKHALSSDGQFIAYETSQAFQSSPTIAGLVLRYNLFSRTTDLIATNATIKAGPYEDIRSLDMTPDGRFIAYIANTNDNSGETTCVQVWDAQTGSMTLASGDINGRVTVNSTCDWLSLDATGNSVTFLSSAAGLVTNSMAGDYHLYQRDLLSGTTVLIDIDTNAVGAGVGSEVVPSISSNGSLIAYHCYDGNSVPDDRNHRADVLVRNLNSGATELVSAHEPSLNSDTPNGNSSMTLNSLSQDGRYVAFASDADNLTAQDTNRLRDVFVCDLALRTNLLVSVDTNGFSGDGLSVEPAITPDGRLVVFSSFADNLAPGDANQAQDIFVRNLQTGVTTLESMNLTNSGAGNGNSFSPLLSSDGRYLLFRSRARDLTSGTFSGENLFLRDRQAVTNYALTRSGIALATMTPDGRFVGFAVTNNTTPVVYAWDSQAGIGSFTNNLGTPAQPFCLAISSAGNRLALGTSIGLYYIDINKGTSQVVDSANSSYSGLRFSADGNFLVYTKTVAGTSSQVYLLDLQANTSSLISHNNLSSLAPGNGDSDSPDLGSDNRFVAYRSTASDLVPGGTSLRSPSIFLFDRVTGLNSLLLLNQAGSDTPNNRSLKPVFSGNGRTLCLESWASDLTAKDLNNSSDLFAFSFLFAALVPGENPPLLSWPYSSGWNYRVQFKDNLDDPSWQDLSGTVTNFGNRGFLADPGAGALHRFYRIKAF